MTIPLPYGPVSPYVTPSMLVAAPTGISWNTIPPGRDVSPAQKLAEQANICARATSQADGYVNQVLRATTDTEIYHGPGDFRVNVQQFTGNTRVILQRWPVLAINSVKVAPNAIFPRQWTTLPTGFYEPENPPSGIFGAVNPTGSGDGGQAIIIAPGYVNWCLGRQGYVIQVQYINGWPHAGLTQSAVAGVTSLPVDDCTGWGLAQAETGLTGITAAILDGGQQEVIQVTSASTTSGPGTLTLASPTLYAHDANQGIIISTLPRSIQWAVILMCTAQALTRGATSTTIQNVPGSEQSASRRAEDLVSEAEILLHPYRRTVLCPVVPGTAGERHMPLPGAARAGRQPGERPARKLPVHWARPSIRPGGPSGARASARRRRRRLTQARTRPPARQRGLMRGQLPAHTHGQLRVLMRERPRACMRSSTLTRSWPARRRPGRLPHTRRTGDHPSGDGSIAGGDRVTRFSCNRSQERDADRRSAAGNPRYPGRAADAERELQARSVHHAARSGNRLLESACVHLADQGR
jgi:hypothetical protein